MPFCSFCNLVSNALCNTLPCIIRKDLLQGPCMLSINCMQSWEQMCEQWDRINIAILFMMMIAVNMCQVS